MQRRTLPLLSAAPLVLACLVGVVASSAQPAAQPPAPPSAPTSPGSTSPGGAEQAIIAVQAFYDKSQTFRSDFQQRFWVKAYNQEKNSRGHVTFAKPGKMDWEYDDPKNNRVVSDGNVIKVYESANKQMYEQPMAKSQYPAALAFLTGTGRLTDAFDFQLVSGQEMQFSGGYVLVGTPKQPTPAYAKVLFYVDAPTSQVRRVMIIDGQGNRNRFDFVNPRVNDPVTPGQFTFTPPPGTSVVHP
jgi:outer membrane lipoprotein carrier protein